MSEHDEEQQTAAQPPIVPDDRHGDTPESGAERLGLSGAAGWRERAFGVKAVAAVAVAGVIVGGGAGAAIHAATADDGGRDGRPGFGRNGGGFGGPGGQLPRQGLPPGRGQMPQPPGGLPAQPPGMPQQPATPPEDGATPDGSGDTTSGNDT